MSSDSLTGAVNAITVADAAKRLGKRRATVIKLIENGILSWSGCVKDGEQLLRISDLERYERELHNAKVDAVSEELGLSKRRNTT